MTERDADRMADLHRAVLSQQRNDMITFLLTRSFTAKAASRAIDNYIETQVFMFRETALTQ